jgi:hypothetical protein
VRICLAGRGSEDAVQASVDGIFQRVNFAHTTLL